MDAKSSGAHGKTIGKTSTELTKELAERSDNTGREMQKTFAGSAWAKTPTQITSTRDTCRVAATVAAEMTGGTWEGTPEMIGEAKEADSMEEEEETDGGEKDERLAAGEA